jgi:hypothetical protein
MIYVTQTRYLEEYKIFLVFSDRREGIVDLKDVIANDSRPIFRALIDLEQFKQFKVAMDTIVWKNGLDLAPEFLYQKLSHTK